VERYVQASLADVEFVQGVPVPHAGHCPQVFETFRTTLVAEICLARFGYLPSLQIGVEKGCPIDMVVREKLAKGRSSTPSPAGRCDEAYNFTEVVPLYCPTP
jgi:hypothetical protein